MCSILFYELKLQQILHAYHTHGHFDHILGSADLKSATSATLHLHAKDATWWNGLKRQVRGWGLKESPKFIKCDDFFTSSHDISVGRIKGRALFTPGHTAGSTSYYFPQLGLVCTGDTLFKLNVGRTDLMDGDFDALQSSIQTVLYALPESTKVIPGHGPATVIALEKRMNVIPALEDSQPSKRESRLKGQGLSAHPCAACDHLAHMPHL